MMILQPKVLTTRYFEELEREAQLMADPPQGKSRTRQNSCVCVPLLSMVVTFKTIM